MTRRDIFFVYDENGSLLREHDQAAGETTYYEHNDNGLASRSDAHPPVGSILKVGQTQPRRPANPGYDYLERKNTTTTPNAAPV